MATRGKTHFCLLDGGLGWLIVFASALSNFIGMGVYRSGGIIYMATVKYFSATRSVAAWVPMVTIMLVYFTAPIGTYLATIYTFHRIAFIGAILAILGMSINFFVSNLETVFIGWSFLFGVGSSLVIFPTLTAVGQCFKKKRPLANSIVLAAAAFGSSFFPPLLELLLDTYGFNGTCLLLAGVAMQFLAVTLILRTVWLLTCKAEMPRETSTLELTAAEDPPEPESNKGNNYLTKLFSQLDLSFVQNCTYLANGFSSAIQVALFFATLTILPDFVVEETGVSRIQGAYLVTAMGFADIASRIPAGICVFKMRLSNSVIYMTVLIVNVLDLLLLVFVKDYYVVMVAAAVGGACFAFGMVLYFEILASCQSPKHFPTAFGLSEMIKAPFLLITATSVGSLKDATGSYSTTFLIFAAAESIAIGLWIFEILWHIKRKPKTLEKLVE